MCSSRSSDPAAEFAAVLARVVDDVAVLTSLTTEGVWTRVASVSAAELTADLLRTGDALGAVANAGIAQVHSSGVLPGGHVSTTRWLQTEGLSAGSASAQLARLHALRDFPRTRLAWLSGDLTADKVRAITLGAGQLTRGRTLPDATTIRDQVETALVPFATGATVAEIRHRLARFRVVLDPDGTDAASLTAYDEQSLTLTPVGDGYDVRGYLAKETAAAVLTALDATVDGWYRTGDLSDIDTALTGDDPRTAARRRARRPHLLALALSELCQRALGSGLGTRHGVPPHLRVLVDADEYRAGLGAELDLPGMPPEPITAAALDRILCDADVTTVLTRSPRCGEGSTTPAWLDAPAREVLYVGRTARTAPPRLRTALEVRDRHCAFPHCYVSATRCHAHHVQPWGLGGCTDIATMTLLCHRHHHLVHEGRWTIAADPTTRPGQTGHWRFDPPEPAP